MMVRTAVCLPLAFLFLANAVSSEATTGEAVVRVAIGAPLTVECGLRAEQRAEWRRDGGPLPPGLRAEEEDGEARLRARLRAAAARPHHAGLYTCTPERDQRVRVLVHAANPAATHAAPGEAAPSVSEVSGGDGSIRGDSGEVLFDVRSNITLRCEAAAGSGAVAWQKNGTALEEVWEMKDRYTLERGGLELHVKRAAEDDFGNYSCSLPGQSPATTWIVRARPHLKLPANSNVVEGQKLKLTCKVIGKPYPRIVWTYSNSTEEDARFEPVTGVNLSDSEQGVVDGTLVLPDAARSHAGRYRCEALDALAPAETMLRVKDKYAALWPFLGICAEVFVLCAIILIYEKRRTKPDLDDSDTDNHDQKKS